MGVLCCSQAKRGERAGSGQIPRTGTPERKSQTVSTTAHPLYPHSLSHSSSEDCNSAELGTPAPQQHPWCSLPQAGVGSAASPHCCSLQLSAPHSGWLHPEMSQGSSIQSHFCPSVNPRLSIIDFCLLLRPRHLQDSREVSTHSPAQGPRSSGVKGDSSPRKHQPWQ